MSERRTDLTQVTPTAPGKATLDVYPHAGQWAAMESTKRFVAIISGTQGGKTVLGARWLCKEIETCGPGDYLVVAPNFPLLSKKTLPEFIRLFQTQMKFGEYKGQGKVFVFSPAGELKMHKGKMQPDVTTQVFFGHATDPESLESATAKAAWLDEAGQNKFKLESWEAILRRLSIHQGRVLISTTPYNLGWLKQKIHDPWVKAGRNHPDIDVIRFDSTRNPAFPRAEFERARRDLPDWKFRMFYMGYFERPAGLIYGNFDKDGKDGPPMVCPRFKIPDDWPRSLGLDFGGVNTAGVFLAQALNPSTHEPLNKYYAYREYKKGERTAAQHAEALLKGEPDIPFAVGGSRSEDQWRDEFAAGGLPVHMPAVTGADSVEVGIDRVYGAFGRRQIIVFDDLAGLLEELATYGRVLDDQGEPTEAIEDPHAYHFCDALRYISTRLFAPDGGEFEVTVAPPADRSILESVPPEVWGAAGGEEEGGGGLVNWGSYDG